jgi:hypothetical protein
MRPAGRYIDQYQSRVGRGLICHCGPPESSQPQARLGRPLKGPDRINHSTPVACSNNNFVLWIANS